MSIDIEATKKKEIFIQAELYRLLRNDIEQKQLMSRGKTQRRRDVLIEASIKQNESTEKVKARKRSDIVLMWKGSETSDPLLVIELKKRTLGSPTKSSKKALRQAYMYARQVGSNLYAAYDGYTFILMQMGYPFLIGLKRVDIFTEGSNSTMFARKVWDIALQHWKGLEEKPLKPFDDYSVFLHWKSTLEAILRDAHKRNMAESEQPVSKEQIDEVVKEIMSIWQRHFSTLEPST